MINRVATFEKVSFDQFFADFKETYFLGKEDECDKEAVKKIYEDIKLPTRATSGSAGYDFYSTVPFTLNSQESVRLVTGIRANIDEGWYLELSPKSGLGTEYRLQLDNTIGKIDSDYYSSKNEGHIKGKLTNDSKVEKTLNIDAGDKIIQGSFLIYGITHDDDVAAKRDGGFGSTGK